MRTESFSRRARGSLKAARLLALLAISVCMTVSCSREDTRDLPLFAYQNRVGDAAAIAAAASAEAERLFTTAVFSSGSMTAEALITGSADFATMGDAAAAVLAARYPEQVVFLAVHGSGALRHRLVIREQPPQRIGVKFGTSTHAALQAWLETEAAEELILGSPQPQLIDLTPELLLTALDSGEIDAAAASEPTPSTALERIAGLTVIPLKLPGRSFPVLLAASRKSLERYPDEAQKLLDLLREGGRRAQEAAVGRDPETLALLSEFTGLEPTVLARSLFYHDTITAEVEPYREELEELSRFLLREGRIPVLPDWEKLLIPQPQQTE
jgi:sulfonate transport system substrate-binding protein